MACVEERVRAGGGREKGGGDVKARPPLIAAVRDDRPTDGTAAHSARPRGTSTATTSHNQWRPRRPTIRKITLIGARGCFALKAFEA